MATKPAYKKTEQRRRELKRCTVVALCPNVATRHCTQCGRRFCFACAERTHPTALACPCCGGSWRYVVQV